MRTPPTMHDLLSDDRYARYIAKPLRLHPNISAGNPFMVIALRHGGAFARALRPTYEAAYEKLTDVLDDDRYMDAGIVSRRRIVKEPYWHKVPGFDWCGRCRRPTVYRVHDAHPALKGAPVIMEGVERCWFCGVSRALGHTSRSVKLKKGK